MHRSCLRSAARAARARSRSSCDLYGERRRVHDPVDLELEEEAVAPRGGELRVEVDLTAAADGLGMHVRVREVAVVKRDEMAAVTDVRVERRHRMPTATDREPQLRLLPRAQALVPER